MIALPIIHSFCSDFNLKIFLRGTSLHGGELITLITPATVACLMFSPTRRTIQCILHAADVQYMYLTSIANARRLRSGSVSLLCNSNTITSTWYLQVRYSQYMHVWASNEWTFGQTDAIALLPPLLVLAYSNLILLRAKRFTDVSIRY